MAATDLEQLVVQLTAQYRDFERDMRKASGVFDREGRKIERRQKQLQRNIDNGMRSLARSFVPTFGAIGAVLSTRQVIAYADKWTEAKNSLRVAGLEGQKLDDVLEGLFQSAQRNYVAINPLVGVYGKAAQVQDELGASTQDLTKFTDEVALSIRVAGSSTEQASGALLQLGQLLGGQKVQAQEYNSIIDGAYPLLQAVAAGLKDAGGSVAKLTQLVKAGKVDVQAFFQAALDGAHILEDKVASSVETVAQAAQKLENAFERYVGEVSTTNGLSADLAGTMDVLADHIDAVVKAALALTAALGTGALVGAVRATVTGIGALSAVIFANPWTAAAIAIAGVVTAIVLFNDKLSKQEKAAVAAKKAQDDYTSANEKSAAALDLAAANNGKLNRSLRDTAIEATKASINTLQYAYATKVAALEEEKAFHARQANFSSPQVIAKWGKELADKQAALQKLNQQITEQEGHLFALSKTVPEGKPGTKPPSGPKTGPGNSGLQNVHVTPLLGSAVTARALDDARRRTVDFEAEGKTLGMTAGAAEAYRFKLQALSEITARNGTVTDAQRAAIETAANIMQRAGDAAEALGRKYQDQVQFTDELRSGLSDVALAGTHGFGSLKSAAASFLSQLADMIVQLYVIKPLLNSLLGSSGSAGGGILGGFISSLTGGGGALQEVTVTPSVFGGYDSGGYTGPGGKYDPAGIVHKGEYVFDQDAVRRIGLPALHALQKGYADGGYVGPSMPRIPSISAIAPQRTGPTIIQQFDLRGAMVDKDVWANVNQIAATHATAAGKQAVSTALKPHVLGPAMDEARLGRSARVG